MINLTVKEFSDMNLYNNRNVEEVMARVIAESSNGILVSVFDDKLVLLDNYEEDFYSADYTFDRDAFVIDNFEKIKLKRDSGSFNESVKSFFKEEGDIEDILESYENIFSESEMILSEDINRRILQKEDKFDFFNEILEAKKELELSTIHETDLYKTYFDRYKEKGSEHAYYFDWKNPVNVSFSQNESKEVYIKTDKEKAKNFWKSQDFREKLSEAVDVLIEDVANGQVKLIELVESYKDLVTLNDVEFKELISKSILMEDYESSATEIVEGIMHLYKDFSLGKAKQEIIEKFNVNEAFGDAAEGMEGEAPEEAPEETPEEAPESVDNEELKTTIQALTDLKEKVEDEKAKSFLEGLVTKLEEMKEDSSVDPELLKEVARLLAPSPEEEEEVPAEEPAPEQEIPAEVPPQA